jgi:hypothetical protein
MAQSLLVLTEPIIPDYGLEEGKHYVGFNTPDGLKEVALDILNNKSKYDKIAKNGFIFAQEYSTSKFLQKLTIAIKQELD